MVLNLKPVFFCLFYAIFNVSGAAFIKKEIINHDLKSIRGYINFLLTWKVLIGFFLIVISALIMFKALSLGSFSYVIPVATGINFLLTVTLGVFIFNDKFCIFSYIGLVLIITGIILMSIRTAT